VRDGFADHGSAGTQGCHVGYADGVSQQNGGVIRIKGKMLHPWTGPAVWSGDGAVERAGLAHCAKGQ
jgi:hypothetical protein